MYPDAGLATPPQVTVDEAKVATETTTDVADAHFRSFEEAKAFVASFLGYQMTTEDLTETPLMNFVVGLATEVKKARAKAALLDVLLPIAHELATQDNRITQDPVFCVQQKRKTHGVSRDYTDLRDQDGPYVEHWEIVQTFLTEKAADRYIAENRHNLHEPRTYVIGAYRNHEWKALRATILGLLKP
jgi:hypothetical protein